MQEILHLLFPKVCLSGKGGISQMRQPTLTSKHATFENLVEQATHEIARCWLASVRVEGATMPTASDIPDQPLLDSIPSLLQEILRAASLKHHESEIHDSAARHGRVRMHQHFAIKELVREYQLLREHTFHYLNEHLKQLARCDGGDVQAARQHIGEAFDDAMCEIVNAFVEEQTQHLRHLARTDSLTNLFNHRTFYERLDEELQRTKRYPTTLSIVIIDLDDFKGVNDSGGHQLGDLVLIKCADLLRNEMRSTDVVCRYGGDEFSLLLPETSCAEAHQLMFRLQQKVHELGIEVAAPATFGMSFGIACVPDDDGTVMRLVRVADERLLANKTRHRK